MHNRNTPFGPPPQPRRLGFGGAGMLLPLGLFLALFSGCENLREKPIVSQSADLLDKAGNAIASQAKALSNWSASERSASYTREVNALFDQPYIDPLTRYLERYRDDASRASHLQRVLAERDARCARIARQFDTRPATAKTLQQFRAGYAYSCPDQVHAFAQRIEARARPAEDEAEALARNNCYLLTTIHNYSAALDACRAPAKQGDVQAQFNMAVIARALQQYPKALHWARAAAPASADAAYLLGQMYAEGAGVTADPAQALQWFEDAAKRGHAAAQYECGLYYAQGRGTAVDIDVALRWLKMAANAEHPQAQAELGLMYLRGTGVAVNATQARTWLIRAARQGEARAQFQLGEIARTGLTAEPSPAQALVWYELASHNGYPGASAAATALRPQVNRAAFTDAQLAVRRILDGGR